MSGINIFQAFGLLSAAQTLAAEVPKLLATVQRLQADPTLVKAVMAAPHLRAAGKDLSGKVRAVQDSAAHVGSNKNFKSKVDELSRLQSHVRALLSAFTTDTHDPEILSEVGRSYVLEAWLSEVSLEWGTVVGALGAFRL